MGPGFDPGARSFERSRRYLAEHGEELAVRERLARRLDEGASACPAGRALVLAAADWLRAGCQAPVPLAKLRGLAEWHLERAGAAPLLADATVAAALEWATGGDPPLLVPAGGDPPAYRSPQPLAGHLDGSGAPLPWEELLALASPLEAVAIGGTAWRDRAEPATEALALRVWRQVAAGGDPDAAPMARLHLGLAAAEQGDPGAAREAFEEVLAAGHFDAAPRAMLELALLDGDDRARPALEATLGTGHPEVVPRAAAALAALLERAGDDRGADAAYSQVATCGDPLEEPGGALGLARVRRRRGDHPGARAAYLRAVASGNPEVAAAAGLELGRLLLDRHDLAGARAAFQQVLAGGGEAATTARAALDLANLHLLLGELAAAEATLELARALRGAPAELAGAAEAMLEGIRLAERDAEALAGAPRDDYNTGLVALSEGRLREAAGAFERALAGPPGIAALAATGLADVCAARGDQAGALAWYERVVDWPDERAAAAALELLALVCRRAGLPEALERARQACWERVREGAGAELALSLGGVEQELGDLDAAVTAWEVAAIAPDREIAMLALLNLGLSRAAVGQRASAALALQRVAREGPAPLAQVAALELGRLAAAGFEMSMASSAFTLALDGEHPTATAEAALHLGLMVGSWQPDDAEVAFALAAEHGGAAPAVLGQALANLGRVYAQQGNRRLAERAWRRGRRHRDPEVAAAFAAERRRNGRVRRRP